MAVLYQKVVAEDLDIGTGTVVRSMPAGGTANGSQVHLGSFAEPGVTLASIGAASAHPGQVRVVSDLSTTTVNIVAVGGGANRGLVFSNGTAWKVAAA